jgi:nucleoside-diphosphate-sugar epimerase
MLKHLLEKSSKPKRVVVLGATGFVATACCRSLESFGVTVLPLSRTELDLNTPEAGEHLSDILKSDDSLLFVAAKAPVKTESMLIENVQMASAVCQSLKKSPVKHLVYISSDAVYADSSIPLSEDSCAHPESLHGVMHLTREVMLSNAYLGPLCFLRPTLIYGVDDPHNGYGPNRFMRQAKKGEDIPLFGEGEERRDHVWIEDVAELTCRILCQQSIGVLNIATGTVVSFRDIAEQVARLDGSASKIIGSERSGPMPHNGYRAFDPSVSMHAFPDFSYMPLSEGINKI